MKKFLDKSGYVSIEAVIVAGLMIGLGVFIIKQLYEAGEIRNTNAMTRINEALDVANTVA